MTSGREKKSLALVGLDIEGDWNVPLLRNAAEISGASVVWAQTDLVRNDALTGEVIVTLEQVLDEYDYVVACESAKRSRSIYEFPSPRGRTAVLMGNEMAGIPQETLAALRQVVSVPMCGKGMSSINVAAAGAVALYVLERDWARAGLRKSKLSQQGVDLLIKDPDDPSELGSLLRSAWAFGWRKVYLSDRSGVWFTQDRAVVMAGRSAARRDKNPIVVSPAGQLDFQRYKSIIMCSQDRIGAALSRFVMPDKGPVLIVFGENDDLPCGDDALRRIYVDHGNPRVQPRFRHAGSILLSMVSQMVNRGKRG